jgi:glycine/D-amino acid oxidase-like deaminating enzyme
MSQTALDAYTGNRYDFIVIGQGICGTLLSYYLHKAGCNFLVIDEARPFTATKVASGVINPVTGRRLVRTWMIEDIMPFAVAAYQQMEQVLGKPLVRQCNILDFHPTPQMHLAFKERVAEEPFLQIPENPEQWRAFFNFPFDIGETNPCWLIDLHTLLQGWRNQLQAANRLLETAFDVAAFKKVYDATPNNTTVLFCDGVAGFDNPWFQLLPYARNKGEALIAEIKGLPATHIYKQGINLVPWQDGLFWIGSSFEWDFTDSLPSQAFRQKVDAQLQHWLKLPYNIIDHQASERPANLERRPFVGLHPQHKHIGIFNGMGTKGCSLSPYFAHQLVNHLTSQTPILPAADVRRFSKVLSRN